MTMLVGGSPGRIYSETEAASGICPSQGERLVSKDGSGFSKEFVMCKVAASQNLISGRVVTISGDYVVTVAAVAQGASELNLGVAITPSTSGTASASTLIWVQIFGKCSVAASTSINPNIALKIGTTAGVVTTAGAVTASAHIHGIILTATSTVSPGLTPAFLNYPRYGTYSF